MNPVLLCRCLISFTWIYHGVFPKLVHIAPIEQAMLNGIGLNEWSRILIPLAGVVEIMFGVVLFIWFRKIWLLNFNIICLLILLIGSIFALPSLLFEAFNPVSTNGLMIGVSFLLIDLLRKKQIEQKSNDKTVCIKLIDADKNISKNNS